MNKMFDAIDALFESDKSLTISEEPEKKVIVEEENLTKTHSVVEPYITLKNNRGKEYSIFKINEKFYNEDGTELTEEELADLRENNEVYDMMKSKAQRVLDCFNKSNKSVENFTACLNEISRLNWDNEISDDLYQDYVKLLQDAYKNREVESVDIEPLDEALFRDKAAKNGIQSYFDMVWEQEPQSEYDKMIQEYMNQNDHIRDILKDARSKYDYKDPKLKKIEQQCANLEAKNHELLAKAEQIPEEERGPLYQDYLKIAKANDDEFAQARGYNSMEDYQNHMFETDLDYEILDKPNDPKDFIVDLPDNELPVDLVKQGKCPYCANDMTDEEYKVFGMCKNCYDNGVE